MARDRYAAADAVAAIDVDYEPLSPVLDIRTALDEGSPQVHEAGNKSYEWVFANGDLDAAFRDAPVVLERNYRQQRLIPCAMEPRAVVCQPIGDEYTLWSATQIPHVLRFLLAAITGIPEQNIRVIAPDVGGGFGSKLQVTAEEVLALLIARRLGRPVKWTESRSEGNMAVHHGRDQWQRIRIAADRDGRIRGLSVDLLADMGAYLMLVTPGVPLLGAFMFPAIYKMDAYSFTLHRGVHHQDAHRRLPRRRAGPRPRSRIERIMDELAAELGIEPLELRERNWIKHEEFPFTTIAGLTYDSGNYEAATAKARELFDYDALRREQAERNARGDTVRLGIGISTFTEMCGLAPSRVLGSLSYGAGGWEHASIRMLPTGKVEVVTGSSAHGQGHETAWSQIVADQLGVPFEDIRVLHGDTQVVAQGHGHLRLPVAGRRRHGRGRGLRQGHREGQGRSRRPCWRRRRRRPGVLRRACSGRGRHRRRPRPSRRSRWPRSPRTTCPTGVEPSLDSDATYDPDNFSFPHGTHLCATEVDTETGMVKIRSYVAVDDVGMVVNPLIVEGQVHGGIAQGIGQALYEEARLRRRRQPGDDHAGRLPDPVGGRPAVLRDRPDREPGQQPARRQGRRRGGHDRVHARRGERHRGRAAAVRRQGRRPCRARPSASGGPSRPPAAPRRTRRPSTQARQADLTQGNSPQQSSPESPTRAEKRHDPGQVRLRAARARWTRRSAPSPTAVTTPRSSRAASP